MDNALQILIYFVIFYFNDENVYPSAVDFFIYLNYKYFDEFSGTSLDNYLIVMLVA